MNLLSKPKAATGFLFDGSLNKAVELLNWLSAAGYIFNTQNLQTNFNTGKWELTIGYSDPTPEGSAPVWKTLEIKTGYVVVPETKKGILTYATEEALLADFDQVESA